MTDSSDILQDKNWKDNLERALELSDARSFFEAMQAVNTAFIQWEKVYLIGGDHKSNQENFEDTLKPAQFASAASLLRQLDLRNKKSSQSIQPILNASLKSKNVDYIEGTILTDPNTFSNKIMLNLLTTLADVGHISSEDEQEQKNRNVVEQQELNEEKSIKNLKELEDEYIDGSYGLSLHERGYDENCTKKLKKNSETQEILNTINKTTESQKKSSIQSIEITARVLASILCKEIIKLYLTRAIILEELQVYDRAQLEYQAILSIIFLEERLFPSSKIGSSIENVSSSINKDSDSPGPAGRGGNGQGGLENSGDRPSSLSSSDISTENNNKELKTVALTRMQRCSEQIKLGKGVKNIEIDIPSSSNNISEGKNSSFIPKKRTYLTNIKEQEKDLIKENDSRLPVSILTGFLGSGKTTLLNKILKNVNKKYAIIENEFGEIGIDDDLIFKRQDIDSEEQIIEVNNGCICCTVRGDLIKALKKLSGRRKLLDGVIIETTGLRSSFFHKKSNIKADPSPIAQTFFIDEDIKRIFRLDCIITIIDANNILRHLNEKKPEGVENECHEQICFADKILLNKLDLLEQNNDIEKKKNEIINTIRQINPIAEIKETGYKFNKFDNNLNIYNELLNVNAFSLNRITESVDSEFLSSIEQEHLHDESITSFSIEEQGELDSNKLNIFLSSLLKNKGNDIFRCKGILAIYGSNKKFVFHGIHMILETEETNIYWEEDQKNSERLNRIVFIGRYLEREEILKGFKSCFIDKNYEKKYEGIGLAPELLGDHDIGNDFLDGGDDDILL